MIVVCGAHVNGALGLCVVACTCIVYDKVRVLRGGDRGYWSWRERLYELRTSADWAWVLSDGDGDNGEQQGDGE